MAFVEVKVRRSPRFGAGEEAIPLRKRRVIEHLAWAWILRHGRSGDQYRFDVVALAGPARKPHPQAHRGCLAAGLEVGGLRLKWSETLHSDTIASGKVRLYIADVMSVERFHPLSRNPVTRMPITVQSTSPSGDSMAADETRLEADKRKALNLAISQIEKQIGRGAIMRMGADRPRVRVAAISTGAINLDAATGIGGVPRGRISEIYGPESSGKTTLCLHLRRQRPEGRRGRRLRRRRTRPRHRVRQAARCRHREPARLAARHRRAGP